MPARLVVGIEHHFPCPLPHSQSDSTSSAIPYQLDAVDPRYLITDLHHVHEPIAFVAPERGLLRLAVAPSSPQNRVDPKRWWSDSGSTKMRVNHWTASLLSLLVCPCLACRHQGPHPACLGGASDFTLIGGARARPVFLRAAAVRNHAFHPHKVGGGVTPSIAVTCAMCDRQSGAVQIISLLQFTMRAWVVSY